MTRRALLMAAVVGFLVAADAPAKDEPAKPATLTWIGAADGKWSVATNWAPAKLPGDRDTVIFGGAKGKDTASTMDLGGEAFLHIAGLEVRSNYTKTITIQSDLYVDVLNLEGGTIDGAKNLTIWQKVVGQGHPATKFQTSFFTGGTIKTNTFTYGGGGHAVTFVLAEDPTLTPHLEANLTIDAFTLMEWKANNMTVGGGKTITLNGHFLADSTGTIGNGTTDWNLDVMAGGLLSRGKGKFDHGKVQRKGGNIAIQVTDGDNGGTTALKSGPLSVREDFIRRVAVVGPQPRADAPTKDEPAKPAKEGEEYAKVELKGRLTLVSWPGYRGPILTVGDDEYLVDLSRQPKVKGEALRKLEGQRVIVTGTLNLPRDNKEMARVLVSSIRPEGVAKE